MLIFYFLFLLSESTLPLCSSFFPPILRHESVKVNKHHHTYSTCYFWESVNVWGVTVWRCEQGRLKEHRGDVHRCSRTNMLLLESSTTVTSVPQRHPACMIVWSSVEHSNFVSSTPIMSTGVLSSSVAVSTSHPVFIQHRKSAFLCQLYQISKTDLFHRLMPRLLLCMLMNDQ